MVFDKSRFAARLRGKRAEKRMSLAALSSATNISAETLASYEKDTGYTPGIDKVVAICRVLGCSPNDLCGWPKA